LGIGMMVLATIPASVFFRRALHRTRSLWGSAFVHGYLNTSPVVLFTLSGDTLLGPGAGVIFVLAQWMLIGIDVLADKRTVKK
jgi:membrane protease YdiL (CAAX protease family)